MSKRKWLLGRTGCVMLAVVSGVLTALWFLRPTPISVAQQSAAEAVVDPRWLALLQAERKPLEGATSLDAPMAGGLTLNALMQDGSVAGFAPTGNVVVITVERDAAQVAYATAVPALTEVGWFYSWTWLLWGEYSGSRFLAGDVITIMQGSQSLSLTVADFQAEADAADDRVSGLAAANADLTLQGMLALDTTQTFSATTTADAQGVFGFDLSATVDLAAGDFGYIRHPLDVARTETTRFVTPRLQVQVGSDVVGGYVAPFQPLGVRVLSGATVLASATGWGRADGGFSLCLTACSAFTPNKIRLQAGQTVELSAGTQTLTMTVPVLTARSNRPLGLVTGASTPQAVVTVFRWPGPSQYFDVMPDLVLDSGVTTTASVTGTFSAVVPLEIADFGAAVVRDANGHLAYARFAVPQLSVEMGQRSQAGALISGQIDRASEPVTVTVIGPSGLPKAEIRSTTTSGGVLTFGVSYPIVSQGGFVISGSDIISITDSSGVVTIVPMRPITATADVSAQRISGRGPAAATMPIHLYTADAYPSLPAGYDVTVLSDLAGFFGIDLVDYHIKASTQGTISWTNSDGHTLRQAFTAGPTCLPDITEVVVGGNTLSYRGLSGDVSSCGPIATVTLRSGTGTLKHTIGTSIFGIYAPLELVDEQGAPIRIEAGDALSIANGTEALTMTVPVINVSADVGLQRVAGHAPAGSSVGLVGDTAIEEMAYVMISAPWRATVVANGNGDFQLDEPIQPGDRIEASVQNRLGTKFTSVAVVPAIQLKLFESQLLAALPPLTPLTVTVQTARPITPTTYFNTVDDRGRIRGTSMSYPAFLPWSVQAGDRLIVQAGNYQRDWLIPSLTAEVDGAGLQVRGSSPANEMLTFTWLTGEYAPAHAETHSDGAGHYALDLPAGVSPISPFKVTLHTPLGDWLSLESGPMIWHIRLNSACMDMRTPRSFASGTLTLKDGLGHVRATTSLVANGGTYWPFCLSDAAGAVVPGAGDRFELVTEVGSWSFVVPQVSAVQDARRGVITGAAPPGGFVTIDFSPQFYDYSTGNARTVTVDSLGRFGVDASDVAWRPGQSVMVQFTDQAGNIVEQTFTLTGIQHWLPIIWHP